MTRGTRLLLTIVLGGVVLASATLAVAATAVYRSGTVAVELDEGGHHVDVRVPAGLVSLAVALAPDAILREATAEMEPWLPALEAGWRELGAAPDFVLVEVSSPGESVRIEKVGDRLQVAVDGPDGRVRVGLPLRTVGSLLRGLDASS